MLLKHPNNWYLVLVCLAWRVNERNCDFARANKSKSKSTFRTFIRQAAANHIAIASPSSSTSQALPKYKNEWDAKRKKEAMWCTKVSSALVRFCPGALKGWKKSSLRHADDDDDKNEHTARAELAWRRLVCCRLFDYYFSRNATQYMSTSWSSFVKTYIYIFVVVIFNNCQLSLSEKKTVGLKSTSIFWWLTIPSADVTDDLTLRGRPDFGSSVPGRRCKWKLFSSARRRRQWWWRRWDLV